MATLASITQMENNSNISSINTASNNNLLDVSFSSYLSNGGEEHNFLGRKKSAQDGEIGVFSAEKYFNGGIDEDTTTPRLTNIRKYNNQQPIKESENLMPIKTNLLPGTPSIISESSWNSQTALLQSNNMQRKAVLQRKSSNKSNGRSSSGLSLFLAGLGCTYCSCSDKDSVDVEDENAGGEISFKKSPNASSGMLQNKPISEELIRTNPDENLRIGINKECFSFATSNPVSVNLANKLKLGKDQEELINPRKSLEVFGSPVHDKKSKSFRIERRLSMFSWDSTPRIEEIEYSFPSSGGVVYNDNESDASSDLFEIESLTGKVTPFLARRESDATNSGCVTPTTCYAPSEASIEWSVVTASAADFSVISDHHEELMRPATKVPSPIQIYPTTTGKETPRRRPSILLGCNSHKAVKVAGNATNRTTTTNDNKAIASSFDPELRRMSDSNHMPVERFPFESKLMSFDSSQKQRGLSTTHSLPRLHPHQSSHLLFIQ